jgi:hypothetical protein
MERDDIVYYLTVGFGIGVIILHLMSFILMVIG